MKCVFLHVKGVLVTGEWEVVYKAEPLKGHGYLSKTFEKMLEETGKWEPPEVLGSEVTLSEQCVRIRAKTCPFHSKSHKKAQDHSHHRTR